MHLVTLTVVLILATALLTPLVVKPRHHHGYARFHTQRQSGKSLSLKTQFLVSSLMLRPALPSVERSREWGRGFGVTADGLLLF
jgi:hypothetical protein